MSEWLNEAFSGGVSLARLHPAGIILIILAVILIAVAQPAAGRMKRISVQSIRIAGLVLCAAGTVIAIY